MCGMKTSASLPLQTRKNLHSVYLRYWWPARASAKLRASHTSIGKQYTGLRAALQTSRQKPPGRPPAPPTKSPHPDHRARRQNVNRIEHSSRHNFVCDVISQRYIKIWLISSALAPATTASSASPPRWSSKIPSSTIVWNFCPGKMSRLTTARALSRSLPVPTATVDLDFL